MLRILAAISILTLIMMACKRTDVAKTLVETDPSLLISMQKTGCYGTCPAYLLEIFNEGKMKFKGYGHTRVDSASSQLTQEELHELRTLISDKAFQDLEDEYIADVSDIPFTHLTFPEEKGRRKISCRGTMPDAFASVASFLSEKVESKGWIKGSNYAPKAGRELIIDVMPSASVQDILQQFETFEMQMVKKLSPGQNLYLLRSQVSEDEAEEMLQVLKNTKGVKAAQWNHILKKRDQ